MDADVTVIIRDYDDLGLSIRYTANHLNSTQRTTDLELVCTESADYKCIYERDDGN